MSEWVILAVLLLVLLAIGGGIVAAVIAVTKSRRATPQYGAPPPYMPQAVQPGWYDDGHGATRWYDGQQWTPHTR